MEFQNNSIILEPRDNNLDLIGLFDFITPALVSMMTTKNTSLLHIPYMKEDLSKKGFFIRTREGKARITLGREFDPCLYRGQCKNFDFIPKFNRIKDKVQHCVEYVKREEFKELFKQTPYYKLFSNLQIMGHNFEFDLDAIAQHYDFATNYLDVTKDIRIALFFAYTDCKNGNYFPIEDFSEYHPHLYIANFVFLEMKNLLTTVGFQGVLRPQKQLAMALNLINSKNNAQDYFSKIELTPNRDIAYGIFKSFNYGKDLFPDEPIKTLSLKVKNNNVLNRQFFNQYCKEFNKKPEELLIDLNKNYEINDFHYDLENDLMLKMNKECDEELLPWIIKNISYRKIKRPESMDDKLYMGMYPLSINYKF